MAADLITLGASTLTFAAPLILAALGGLCSERSGIINIGLEGKMLGAACATGMIGQASGNAALGLAAGLITAILLSLAHWMFTQNFRMDHIVSGMAINALSAGELLSSPKRAVPILPVVKWPRSPCLPSGSWLSPLWSRFGTSCAAPGLVCGSWRLATIPISRGKWAWFPSGCASVRSLRPA